MSAYNFIRSGPTFTISFCSTTKRLFSSTPFRFCRYLHRFQKYLQSNSKIVVNRTDFGTFFALPNFKGGGRCPQKLYSRYHPDLEPRQVPKFRQATPPNSEVISAPLLHFKPIFDPPPLKKVVSGAAVPVGGCASKTWSFSSACKDLAAQHRLRAEICSSEKCALGMST